jgi:hypothetical protein
MDVGGVQAAARVDFVAELVGVHPVGAGGFEDGEGDAWSRSVSAVVSAGPVSKRVGWSLVFGRSLDAAAVADALESGDCEANVWMPHLVSDGGEQAVERYKHFPDRRRVVSLWAMQMHAELRGVDRTPIL